MSKSSKHIAYEAIFVILSGVMYDRDCKGTQQAKS